MKNPVNALKPIGTLLWGLCSMGGAFLVYLDPSSTLVEVGRFLLGLCLGFMVFGFFIKDEIKQK